MDAKEWSKMADKLAQVRSKLYETQMNAEEYDTEADPPGETGLNRSALDILPFIVT